MSILSFSKTDKVDYWKNFTSPLLKDIQKNGTKI